MRTESHSFARVSYGMLAPQITHTQVFVPHTLAQVQSAERRGAAAVLLYGDPQQYAPFGEDAVYPNTVYLPPSGAPSGTVYINDGDPLTPFYPATGMHHDSE